MAASRGVVAYLPQILLYPLRGAGPPIILVITILLVFGTGGLAGLPLLIVGTIWLAHYAIRVIEQTSLGHARPPALGGEALYLSDLYTWSAMLAPALFVLLWWHGQLVVFTVLALLLPAHWMALATTRSLAAACHPLRLLQIVMVSGPAYLAIGLVGVAAAGVGRWLAAWVDLPLRVGAWLYLLIAACHLLGFVAYQRHERLGIGVQVPRPTREREQAREQQQRLDRLMRDLEQDLAQGRRVEGRQRLLDSLPGPADAHRFHEALYERLKLAPMQGLALTQAARMISFLLDRKLLDRALEVFENALDLDERFRLESPLQLPALAERALLTRQLLLFARLLRTAAARYAGDPALRLLDPLRVREALDIRQDDAAARALLCRMGDLDQHPCAEVLKGCALALGVDPAATRRVSTAAKSVGPTPAESSAGKGRNVTGPRDNEQSGQIR